MKAIPRLYQVFVVDLYISDSDLDIWAFLIFLPILNVVYFHCFPISSDSRRAPQKENKHRAMDDIKESIAELKYYRDNVFKPRSRN